MAGFKSESVAGLRRNSQQIKEHDSAIYIFGHSDGSQISLKGEPSTVSNSDKRRYILDSGNFPGIFLKEKVCTSKTICFINGCRSGGPATGDAFLSVTSSDGFTGFIGTEAEISNVEATCYAVAFLDLLLNEGKTVLQIMESLREDMFPASLWYTCFGDPTFHLEGNHFTG